MSVIPYATFFIDYGLNMTATGHVDATIRISDVTQPLNFGVFNRVPKQLLMSLLVIEIHEQCGFLGTFSAIAYNESPVFEVGLFLPRS